MNFTFACSESFSIGKYIILDERGYALLIQPHQYKDGAWTFVGDGVEDGETSLQTITREMLEEVGLEHFIGIEKSQNQHMFTFSAVEKQKRGLDYDGQLADIFLVRVATHSKIYDSTGRGQELLLGPTSRCQGLR